LALNSTYLAFQADASAHSSGGINLAIWISLAALLVSAVLPLYLDRRQSPQVTVRVSRLVHLNPQNDVTDYYIVSAINHGRSEVQINQINISYLEKGGSGEEVFLLSDFKRGPGFEQGLGLSYSLGPYSNAYFGVIQGEVDGTLDGDLSNYRIYGSLYLSNGYRVVSRRGLRLESEVPLKRRHPRIRRIRLLIFAKEKTRR
jgi:hypothetical protein